MNKQLLMVTFLAIVLMFGSLPWMGTSAGTTDNDGTEGSRASMDDITADAWEEIPFLDGRDYVACTSDPTNGDIYLFGGRVAMGYTVWGPGNRNDLWMYNHSSAEWARLHDGRGGPSDRSGASIALDPVDEILYLAGGTSGTDDEWDYKKDLWSFDLVEGRWTLLVASLGEYISDIAYLDGTVYGFTGKNPHGMEIKLLVYTIDTGTWHWYDIDDPSYQTRQKYASAFDPVHKRYFIFGGFKFVGEFVCFDDLWVLNIASRSLTKRASFPGGDRMATDLSYDKHMNALYMYGGQDKHVNYQTHDDLWIYYYQNNTWRQLDKSARPGDQEYHATVYDHVNGLLYLYCSLAYTGDAQWRYDVHTAQWKRLPTNIYPKCLRYGTLAYRDGRVCAVGGKGLDRTGLDNRYYEYNISKERWTYPYHNVPYQRYLHEWAVDRSTGRLYQYGGFDGQGEWDSTTYYNDPGYRSWFKLDWDSWSVPTLANGSLAYAGHNRTLYLWGGHDVENGVHENQLWALDVEQRKWRMVIESIPSYREHTTMVYNRFDESLYLFGGITGRTVLNQMYRFDIASTTWSQVEYKGQWPAARYQHAAVYHPYLNCMIVSGGLSGSGSPLNDLWIYSFNDETWTRVAASNAPGARYGHDIALDLDNGHLYLHGGREGETSLWRLGIENEIGLIIPRTTVIHAKEDEHFSCSFDNTSPTPVTWTFKSDATWLTWDEEDHNVSGTPHNGHVGDWWVRVTISREGTTVDFLDLTVIVDNAPPEIIRGDIPNAIEDQEWSYDLACTDDGQGEMTWDLNYHRQNWLSIDNVTGVLRGIPGNDDVGLNRVTVSVDDGNGGKDLMDVVFEVENVNDDPVIITANVLNTSRDQFYMVQYEAEDIDPTNDPMTWSMETDATFLTINPNNGQFYGTPGRDDVGEHHVRIWVEDGNGGYCETAFILKVYDEPPRILGIGIYSTTAPVNLGLRERETMRWKVYVVDNNLAEVELTVDNSQTGIYIDDEDYLVVDGRVVQPGEYIVMLTATDDVGSTDHVSVTVVIEDVNFPPQVRPVMEQLNLTEDVPFTLNMFATDIDNDPIIWTDETYLFDIEPTTGTISFTPREGDQGIHRVRVTASDGAGGEGTTVLTLRITQVNDKPVIHSLLPLNGTAFGEGQVVNFSCNASDEETAVLNITWTWKGRVIGHGPSIEYDGLPTGKQLIEISVSDGWNTVNTTLEVVVEEGPLLEVGSPIFILLLLAVVVIVSILVVHMFRIRPKEEAK